MNSVIAGVSRTALALTILILVACGGGGGSTSPAIYTVSGSVSGLSGSGLVLRDNNGNDLAISANGPFTFPTPLASGAAYAVSVNAQPANPNQNCVVSNGSGTVGSAAVTAVGITCTNLVYLYVANHDSDNVSAFSVDGTTGALSAVPGNPLLAGWSGPQSGAIDPTGRFAYFANTASNNASAFSIDATTGQLTPVAERPIVGLPQPVSVAVDPNGRFAYIASEGLCTSAGNCDAGGIFAYTIDAISGALTPVPGSPFNDLQTQSVSTVALDPNGKFVYTSANSYVYAFAVNPTTGALSPPISNVVGNPPLSLTSVVVEPGDKFAYIGGYSVSPGTKYIYPFTVDSATGALTPAGAPVVADSFGASIDPQGKFLFDGSDVFAIDAVTGTLINVTAGAPAAGPGPITFNPASAFAYAATDAGVWEYSLDKMTGAYRALAGSPLLAGGSPTSVTIEPQGNYAYVTNSGSDTISAYAIDAASGTLKPLAYTASGIGNPAAIATDPGGRFAYVANNRSASISQYSIQGTTGAFGKTPIRSVPAAASIVSVSVEPRGRFVYAVNDVPYDNTTGTTPAGNVFAYSVDASTGELIAAPGSPYPTGTSPKEITFDPGGRFAYVANYGSQNLSIYLIDGTTGALAPAGSPFDTKSGYPQSLTVDPLGKFVFITGSSAPAQSTDSFIEVCTIDANNGALGYVTNNGGTWSSGLSSVAVAAEPSGKFVYVVNNGSNDVSAYAVNVDTGMLTPVGGSPFAAGPGPVSVMTDPSGKFAYVLDAGSSPGQILTFSIGPSGALSQLPGGATTVGSGPVGIAVSL